MQKFKSKLNLVRTECTGMLSWKLDSLTKFVRKCKAVVGRINQNQIVVVVKVISALLTFQLRVPVMASCVMRMLNVYSPWMVHRTVNALKVGLVTGRHAQVRHILLADI